MKPIHTNSLSIKVITADAAPVPDDVTVMENLGSPAHQVPIRYTLTVQFGAVPSLQDSKTATEAAGGSATKHIPKLTSAEAMSIFKSDQKKMGGHRYFHGAGCMQGIHLWHTKVGERRDLVKTSDESRVRYAYQFFPNATNSMEVVVHALFHGLGANAIFNDPSPGGVLQATTKVVKSMAGLLGFSAPAAQVAPTGTGGLGAVTALLFFSDNVMKELGIALKKLELSSDDESVVTTAIKGVTKDVLTRVNAIWVQRQIDFCKAAGHTMRVAGFADTMGGCSVSMMISCRIRGAYSPVHVAVTAGGEVAVISTYEGNPRFIGRSQAGDPYVLTSADDLGTEATRDQHFHYPGLYAMGPWIRYIGDCPASPTPKLNQEVLTFDEHMMTGIVLRPDRMDTQRRATAESRVHKIVTSDNIDRNSARNASNKLADECWSLGEVVVSVAQPHGKYVVLHTGRTEGTARQFLNKCTSVVGVQATNLKKAKEGKEPISQQVFVERLVNCIAADNKESFKQGTRVSGIQAAIGWDITAACILLYVGDEQVTDEAPFLFSV